MPLNSQEPIRLTRLGLAVALIVLFGVFVRVNYLERMAFHHDESIHAYYSYKVYMGDLKAFPYDPTYHGPFLYHFGALFFLLFGDSDFVARLPFVTLGVVMLYLVWRLRPWIGTAGALGALILTACSPTLTYFSRFARNDIYMGTFSVGILVFALEYLRSRKTSHLAWMTFFLALMYCCKENSYMTGFFLGSFVVLYGLYYLLSYPREARSHALVEIFTQRRPFVKILTLYALFSCFAFSYVFYVAHHPEFQQKIRAIRQSGEDLSIEILRSSWSNFVQAHSGLLPVWLIVYILLAAALFLLYAWLGKPSSPEPNASLFDRIVAQNLPVVFCVFIAVSLFALLFTYLGSNRQGLHAGVIDYLLYWIGQQGNPRIAGPPDYFLPRILIYEFLPLAASLLAVIVYLFNALRFVNFIAFLIAFYSFSFVYVQILLLHTPQRGTTLLLGMIGFCIALAIVLGKKIVALFSFIPQEWNQAAEAKEETRALSPDGFRMFLIYWSILSLMVYALLQEKVPWLLVHQVLPLCLLGGVFIGDVWNELKPGAIRPVYLFLVGFFVLYEARTNLILNFYQNDDPRETMVYTQTSHMIETVLSDIKDAAERLGPDYLPPIPKKPIAMLAGEANWPYTWYLRHYMTTPNYSLDVSLPDASIPFVLCEPKYEDRLKLWTRGQYTKRRIKHQEWWPPPGQRELPFSYFKSRGRPQIEAWRALLRYVLYREIWNLGDPYIQPGSKDLLVYAKTPLLEPEETPQVPAGYEKPPVALIGLATIGKVGAGQGEFNEPRGVALSPDESKLYVLDGKNGRVQIFDTNLNYITYLGGPGSQPGEFNLDFGGPNGGIGLTPDGALYITDTWADKFGRINRYDPEGKPLSPIVRGGNMPFFSPRGLALSSDGRLFISDTGNNQIVWFKPDGGFGGTIATGVVQEPVGITVGPNGLLYVCDVKNHRVACFTLEGRFIREWQILGWKTSEESAINWIEPYVAVDQQGYIYVTDSTNNSIHRFNQAGTEVVVASGQGVGGRLNKPKGITVDSQGNLYVADSWNNRVVKVRFP